LQTLQRLINAFAVKHVIEIYVRFTTTVQSDVSMRGRSLKSVSSLIDGLVNNGVPQSLTRPEPDTVSTYRRRVSSYALLIHPVLQGSHKFRNLLRLGRGC